eukprot:15334156-Ditylum_brightwellii.AAC.1
MNSLVKLTPNATQLRKVLGKQLDAENQKESAPDNLDIKIQDSLLTELIDIQLNIKCNQEHLGFVIKQDKDCNRGLIHDIIPTSTASGICNWKQNYSSSHITQINKAPVFTKEGIQQELCKIQEGTSKLRRGQC